MNHHLSKAAKVEAKDIGIGAGAGLALGGLGVLLRKPMLRRELGYTITSAFKGGRRGREAARALPRGAVADARMVAQKLREVGIDPTKARIAVSGSGGTGKSTFSKALSQEIGAKHIHLDDIGNYSTGRDLVRALKNKFIPRGSISEQTHLISQVNPDKFDVLIRLHKPMKSVKAQLKSRGRGAMQWDAYNYEKVHKTIETAFNKTEGEAIRVKSGIDVKVKPEGGFKGDKILDAEVRRLGIDPEGMTRQSKAITVATGKKERLPGTMPYVNYKSMGEVAALPAGGIAAGAGVPYAAEAIMDKKAELTTAERAAIGVGTGVLGAGIGAAAFLARRPLTRADLFHKFKSMLKGRKAKAAEMSKELPPGAIEDAKKVIQALKDQGLDPKKARIAISGTPGTGKTTFSTAFSKELGIEHVHLDRAGQDLSKHPFMKIKEGPPSGAIYDQTYLLSQVNPDKFDALIRIHRPMETVKKQLKKRKRSAMRWDFLNYKLLHESIQKAFDSTKGDAVHVTKNLSVKVKPKGGFEADKMLDMELAAKGINSEGFNRHRKVLSAALGKKSKSGVDKPYIRTDTVRMMHGLIGGGAAAGSAAGIAGPYVPKAIERMGD